LACGQGERRWLGFEAGQVLRCDEPGTRLAAFINAGRTISAMVVFGGVNCAL